jgi:hypothetical protein
MSRRERRQRLALDLSNNVDEEPFSVQDQANVEEQVCEYVVISKLMSEFCSTHLIFNSIFSNSPPRDHSTAVFKTCRGYQAN